MNKYEDIINLPHYVSLKYPRMSIDKRAAQFAPFNALTGYNDLINEKIRLKDKKVELTDDEKILLNNKLNILNKKIGNQPKVIITYFDNNTEFYETIESKLKKIDLYFKEVVLENKKRIFFDNILDIEF